MDIYSKEFNLIDNYLNARVGYIIDDRADEIKLITGLLKWRSSVLTKSELLTYCKTQATKLDAVLFQTALCHLNEILT